MAKNQLTYPKMFNANWTEKDEAILIDLLKRKIDEIPFEIRQSNSPYVKARLRAKRKEYKGLLKKVASGDYDSNIIAHEMASARLNQQNTDIKQYKNMGKYVDSYQDINFDFQGYFKKSRYYGTALPIFSLIITLIFVTALLFSVFMPTATITQIETMLNDSIGSEVDGPRLSIGSVAYIKLDENNDYRVYNNGRWPKGTFIYPEEALEYGEIYYDENGEPVADVLLFADLGMETIEITVADVLRAFFRTPLMADNKIDIIENLDGMQGGTWYYNHFIRNREDDIAIKRGEDGKYDALVIVHNIATYGTIAFVILAVLACVVEIIFCIGRLFSFTSRKFHFMPLLILVFTALALISPAFAKIPNLDGATISATLKEYFSFNWSLFLVGDGMISVSIISLISTALMVVAILLPFIFRNRTKLQPTYVPKGNRPHSVYNKSKTQRLGDSPVSSKRENKRGASSRNVKAPSYQTTTRTRY